MSNKLVVIAFKYPLQQVVTDINNHGFADAVVSIQATWVSDNDKHFPKCHPVTTVIYKTAVKTYISDMTGLTDYELLGGF